METTEKGMKIVVTRAPRVRKANYAELPSECYYLGGSGFHGNFALAVKDVPPRRVDNPFTLPYDLNLGYNEVVPFDSFEQMCQWVSNGRKLEDLGGDGKDEWVGSGRLERGKYYTLMGGDSSLRNKIVGHVFFFQVGLVNDFPVLDLSSGIGYRQDAITDCMFWPSGAGDTITITCK